MSDPEAYTYRYPRPMVTVDTVIFTVRQGVLHVLLIQRGHEPFKGMWATPGGFLDMDEELEHAAARELLEETGVACTNLEQLHAFGGVDRDPRGRVITVVYLGLVDWRTATVQADDDAAHAEWLPAANLPAMACDHRDVVEAALARLKELVTLQGPQLALLPETLPFDELDQALSCL